MGRAGDMWAGCGGALLSAAAGPLGRPRWGWAGGGLGAGEV